MYAVLFLVFFVIAGALAYVFVKRQGARQWEEPSKTNLNNVIDNSHFFSRMTAADLKARGAATAEEYKERYKSSLSRFSGEEARELDLLVEKAKAALSRYKNISRVPWKLAKSSGVEGDMPHTVGDIVVLPSGFLRGGNRQLETLIHEQMHVYQRIHPIETSKLFSAMGFRHWKQGRLVPLLRNNPDNDGSVYSLGGVAQAQLYSSASPGSLGDSALKTLEGSGSWDLPVAQREHPNEVMACWVSKEVLGEGPEHAYKKTIRSWMNEFL